jgi:predicted alpha/beta-fold hydrolase
MKRIQFSFPEYRPPIIFKNGHLGTILPNLLRKSDFQYSQRGRLETKDGDFLIVDRYLQNSSKALVLLHGVEGSSLRPYMRNLAKVAVYQGLDIVALNFRSCGGEMNLKARFYHSGETSDLGFLLDYLKEEGKYQEIYLAGFSLGGNVLLKYLSEKAEHARPFIKGAMAVSVPVDLEGSAKEIDKFSNSLYLNRFLKSLKGKIRTKMLLFPHAADWDGGLKAKGFQDFDDAVTAPLHGFESVRDYYTRASSLPLLQNIKVPTLLLNAKDDSFLSKNCYPAGNASPYFNSLYPSFGGHVGFAYWPVTEKAFTEQLFLEFLSGLENPVI